MNEDLFGSLAAGRGPYGGPRGKSRMDKMKENIVKEYEEEQRKKREAEGVQGDSKVAATEETKKEVDAASLGGSTLAPEVDDGGKEVKKKKSWRDGLKNMVGK